MSKKKLIKVLGSLKPWELKAPLVAATIKVVMCSYLFVVLNQLFMRVQFIITKVIYIVEEDYQQWLENHTIISDTIQLKRKAH